MVTLKSCSTDGDIQQPRTVETTSDIIKDTTNNISDNNMAIATNDIEQNYDSDENESYLVMDAVCENPDYQDGNIFSTATIGAVNVTGGSHDVRVGHNIIYQAPITINKVLTINDLDPSKEIQSIQSQTISQNNIRAISSCSDESKTNNSNEKNEINTTKLDDGLFIITNKEVRFKESDFRKGLKYVQHLPHIRLIIIVSTLLVILTFVILTSLLLTKRDVVWKAKWNEDSNELDKNTPIGDTNTTITVTSKLRIISRLEWVAQPPVEEANNLTLPVPYIILHHTATEGCKVQSECVFQSRYIQTFHIESKGWWDIGYNFLIGGDGFVYEGRGWYKEGAHVFGYNAESLGFAFIGTFDKYLPPPQQLQAAKKLIAKAEQLGLVTSNYKLLTARQLSGTISPGKALHEEIITWPHWSEKP